MMVPLASVVDCHIDEGVPMYARLTTFPLLPGSRAAVEEGNDEWARLLAAQPGHRRTVFYFTATEDQFGSISTQGDCI